MKATFRHTVLALAFLVLAQPAAAQWTRVEQVPITTIISVWVNGDTITAGAESTVYVSTNAGVTWKSSAIVVDGALEVRVRTLNGRIYAATRRKGIFVSDDLGTTWTDFNQGLVGGFANSQLDIVDLAFQGDSLYLATEGSGAWVRNLHSGTWSRFGNIFGPAQATNMTAIAAGNGRLWSAGGFNGTVFYRDGGDPDWTESLLFNDRIAAGLAALSAIWTGTHWVVGSNIGIFVSDTGQEPWTFSDPGAGRPLFVVPLALHGHDIFANFGAFTSTIAVSHDDGFTWQLLETLPVPVPGLAVFGNTLYAGRTDGLWRRSIETVSVAPQPTLGLRFAVAGSQPVRDDVRLSFNLPEAGHATIEVFNIAGRHVSTALDASVASGPHTITWSARELTSGIYYARLNINQRAEVLRLVRVR